jgi:hypothetical protein
MGGAKRYPSIAVGQDDGFREGLNLIPQDYVVGDLPVGHFCVESPLQKYFASPVGQIISTNSRHPTPLEGRWPSSRTRGGMRWTRQRQARNVMQGGFLGIREQSNGELTNGAATYDEIVWS